MVAALLGVSLALHLPGLVVRLFSSDEASIATEAMVIARGGKLYHQVADRKPPVVPYVVAAVFAVSDSHDLRPVRVVLAVAVGLTAILLACEAERRSRSRRAGVWCGVLFLFAVASFFPDDSQGIGFELFMLLPMTAAVVAAGRDQPARAGVWLALACLCKQTGIVTALPVLYLLHRSGGWRRQRRAVVAAATVTAVTALALGPRALWLWTVGGNSGYLSLHGSVTTSVLAAVSMSAALAALNLPVLFLAGRAAKGTVRGADGSVAPELWLWLGAGAVAVAAGFRFFGHYYLQLVPPVALIAAGAVPAASDRLLRRVAVAAALAAVVMTGAAFVPQGDTGTLPWRAVGERVRDLTRPSQTVFVWGELPEVYVAADRLPATRFVHTGFLTGNTGGRANGSGRVSDGVPGAWPMLLADVARRPPDLIVDTSTAKIRQQEYYPLSTSPLWSFVASNYRLVATVDGVNLYRYEPGTG